MRTTRPPASSGSPGAPPGMSTGGGARRCERDAGDEHSDEARAKRRHWKYPDCLRLPGPYARHLSILSRVRLGAKWACTRFSTAGRSVEHRDSATVLRPAGDVVANRDRPLLAIANRPHARSGHALSDEIIMHRLRASRAKSEIVFPRAALVGVPLNGEAVLVVLIEPGRLLVERCLGGRREVGLIGGEEDAVADRLVEFLHAARTGRAIASGEVVGIVVGAGAQGQAEAERRRQRHRAPGHVRKHPATPDDPTHW